MNGQKSLLLYRFPTDERAALYQRQAVNRALEVVAGGKTRILLTLATGTGKTFIASQVAWKLFKARWNQQRDGVRSPRILFLADRNVLANQAFLDFTAFNDDALVRIDPKTIKQHGGVPQNASVFFTIFQTFMSGDTPNFEGYSPDFLISSLLMSATEVALTMRAIGETS